MRFKSFAVFVTMISCMLAFSQEASAHYHPTLGRWMQRDPAGYVDGGNLYQAECSNPTIKVDPTGLGGFEEMYVNADPSNVDLGHDYVHAYFTLNLRTDEDGLWALPYISVSDYRWNQKVWLTLLCKKTKGQEIPDFGFIHLQESFRMDYDLQATWSAPHWAFSRPDQHLYGITDANRNDCECRIIVEVESYASKPKQTGDFADSDWRIFDSPIHGYGLWEKKEVYPDEPRVGLPLSWWFKEEKTIKWGFTVSFTPKSPTSKGKLLKWHGFRNIPDATSVEFDHNWELEHD